MRKITTFNTIIWLFLGSLQLNAAECVGVQMDNQGLVTNIVPLYRSPVLTECGGVDKMPMSQISAGERLTKYVVDLKKSPSAIEKEMERLQSLPPMNIPIKSCPLYGAISLCAEAANMNYVAPPKDEFRDTVTLKVHASPYEILKMLSEHHGLGMQYDRNMWHFFRINENELVTRKYQLLYNNQEIVKVASPSLNKTIKSSSNSFMGCNSGSGDNSGTFSVNTQVIVNEIKQILELPTTGLEATIEGGGSVNYFSNISSPSLTGTGKEQNAPKGKVLYISDTNELMIVATRQQHSYIQSYLESVDQPQRLIKIEAKFVETCMDPKTEMGIDWSGVSGARVALNNVSGDLVKGGWPATSILSASDMAVQFNFIKTDSNSTIVQDPQVVTTNNRKVSLKSVVQQPIESANNNQMTSGGSNSTSTIDYLEIGTIIDVFPQIMAGSIVGFEPESVQLSISIVVSSIVGEKEIRGNPYPVVSSRTYDYSVIIPSGYTLAIGGLSESNHTTSETRLPILGDIPVLGHAFRSKKDKQTRRNLVAYITPTILDSKSREIAKK